MWNKKFCLLLLLYSNCKKAFSSLIEGPGGLFGRGGRKERRERESGDVTKETSEPFTNQMF